MQYKRIGITPNKIEQNVFPIRKVRIYYKSCIYPSVVRVDKTEPYFESCGHVTIMVYSGSE